MSIVVRPAVDADLPILLSLYAQLHPDDPPMTDTAAEPIWRAIGAQAGRTVLVAESDDMVAGTVDCTVLPNLTRGGRPFLLVENVVVAADRRRLGVGSALMDAAVALAQRTGCYKLQLLSRASRTDAHTFYESLGFRPLAQGYRRYLD